MPPRRGGAAADPDRKDREFRDFKASNEYQLINNIFTERSKPGEVKELNNGTDDITGRWDKVLNSLFGLVEGFKVPGRRSKCKLQTVRQPLQKLLTFLLYD